MTTEPGYEKAERHVVLRDTGLPGTGFVAMTAVSTTGRRWTRTSPEAAPA